MITSTANQQVKLLVQLNKKRKLRDERGVFVVEGPKMFREAPKERIEKAYFSETFFEKHKETLTKRIQADGLEYEIIQDHIFKTAIPRRPRAYSALCGSRPATFQSF